MAMKREVWEIWERLYDPAGDKKIFDGRYGPTPQCFSANDIVRMFRLGALARDVDHLKACRACPDRVKRYSLATGAEMPEHVGTADAAVGPCRALLHIPVAVPVIGTGEAEAIRVWVTTGMASACKGLSLYLEGAVEAEAVCPMAVPGEDWAEVLFKGPRVSPEVLKQLKRHARVTEQVTLRAAKSELHKQIVGTSNIDFKMKA